MKPGKCLLFCLMLGSALPLASRPIARPELDRLPVLQFWGDSIAELYTREINESYRGVLRLNYIAEDQPNFPAGFVRASIEPFIWNNTLWTRDAGTFLRELTHWGMLEHACLTADYLIDHVALNEEGYHSFPEYFRYRETKSGKELDGTSAIVIALVDLWKALPNAHPLKTKIHAFLQAPSSPLQYILYKLSQGPLLSGEGEFGPGCFLEGEAINVVQNKLARLALLAGSEMARLAFENEPMQRYRQGAGKISANMKKWMAAEDGTWLWCIDPVTLKSDSAILGAEINRGAALINGVSCMSSDVMGFLPAENDDRANHRLNLNTFLKLYHAPQRKTQFDRYGIYIQFEAYRGGYSSGPSYGDGYAVQTMLLNDLMDMADRSLRWIATSTYRPIPEYKINRDSPYFFYERSYSPEAVGKIALDQGCGPLNLVNVTEQLKTARLIVGTDGSREGTLRIIPRIPPSWTGYRVENWPVVTPSGIIRINLSYRKTEEGIVLNLKSIDGDISRLSIRLPHKNAYRWIHRKDVSELNLVL